MAKTSFVVVLLSFFASVPTPAVSEKIPSEDRLSKAFVYLMKNQIVKAEEILRNPTTSQEKGLYASIIGYDNANSREFGFTAFDAKKAHTLVTEVLADLVAEAENDARSARILCLLYYKGIGVQKDIEKAFKYCSYAALNKNPGSMYNLGVLYFNGIGASKDRREGIKWFERAVAHRNTAAMGVLADILEETGERKNLARAHLLRVQAAKAGNSSAMFTLSLESFKLAIESDKMKNSLIANGKLWMERSSKAGYVPAMLLRGRYYEKGVMYNQDPKEAIKWYQKAADSGLSGALFVYAECYEKGLGVPQNIDIAKRIYEQANTAAKKEGNKKMLAKIEMRRNAQLKLLDWHWKEEYDFAIVEGQVQNITARPLRNVEAVAVFKSENGELITSTSSLIEYNPIMPGQTSPFKVMVGYNPRMKNAGLDFKFLMGVSIPFYRPD